MFLWNATRLKTALDARWLVLLNSCYTIRRFNYLAVRLNYFFIDLSFYTMTYNLIVTYPDFKFIKLAFPYL